MDLIEREAFEAILEMPKHFSFAEKQACIDHSIVDVNVGPTLRNFKRCVICDYYASLPNR
jgi:hypothetical protein